MLKEVFLGQRRVKLLPTTAIGKGGEADVYDLGDGRALKVFKTPDHPDYQGQPAEQQAAEQRIALQQLKLRAFPTGLPSHVVTPGELAFDRSGRQVLGYAMPLVRPAEPLLRLADPALRRSALPAATVVELFRDLHRTLSGLHAAGVVVGDLNDLNILVQDHTGWFIDADSFQFGAFACSVFTERFVDPLLCDRGNGGLQLARPFAPTSDWYAYAALLMQTLLCVGPYGGVYRPRSSGQRLAQAARPLQRITVFHPDVVYPRPALALRTLPDDLLEQLRRVFERDERAPFPRPLLDSLHFNRCPHCHLEHARLICPACSPAGVVQAQPVLRVHGDVNARPLFDTGGTIVHACLQQGELRYLFHTDGRFSREDGKELFRGDLEPSMHFAINGNLTLVGRGSELVALEPGRPARRRTIDTGQATPVFGANGRHVYWTGGGQLRRDGATALSGLDVDQPIGDVLADQTRFWIGPTFGLGFYCAGELTVAFVFDAEQRGLNDSVTFPALRGQLIDARCCLDEQRAWLLLALHIGGRTRHRCLVYRRTGQLEAALEVDAGDGSWLGTLGGQCATGGVLFAPTDSGVVRVEVSQGQIAVAREFVDTSYFVDAASQLLAASDGLLVVGRNEIVRLSMK